MRVHYITMQFPAPSETFAASDIRALRRIGVHVSVHSLRTAHRNTIGLSQQMGLNNIEMTFNSLSDSFRGICSGLLRPSLLAQLLAFIVKRNWNRPGHLFKSLVFIPRCVELFVKLETQTPDVVHLFWGHFPALLGYLVQHRLRTTVLSVFLGAYDLEMEYGCSAPVARGADLVWTHAYINVPALLRLRIPQEKIQVSHRGLDLSRIAEGKVYSKIPKRIVTASRLIQSKGVDDVLKVFARVLERWEDASLVVLGDGPDMERLKSLAAELKIDQSVSFMGHRSQTEVVGQMMQAEIFLLMSRKQSERLPNVVKEAMACRCLTIATNTPGIDELLIDGRHGFVVPQGDIKKVATLIHEVFSGDVPGAEIAVAASDHVSKHFDVNVLMSVYHREWRRVLERKNDRGKQGAVRE